MYFASYDDKEIARLHLSFNDIYFLEWFINWRISNKMLELPENNKNRPDNKHYFWLKYSKIIKDLPALQMHNNVSVSNMLNRLCGKGKVNQHEYPLIRTFANINCVNRAYYATRPEVIAKMKGVEYKGDLFDEETLNNFNPIQKNKNKTPICSLLPNTEKILIELNKLYLSNGKKLFSFTLPTDHKIYTQGMMNFQGCLNDLYHGLFNKRNPLKNWFKERNKYYITDFTMKEINACKGNWDQISMVVQCAAKNYMSWWDKNRETVNKSWLTRDIGQWMYYGKDGESMFMVSIRCKASETREVIAENMYNRLPENISNKFLNLYNENWDNLTYWQKVYSAYKWYKDNAKKLMNDNINYKYWLDSGVEKFMEGYYDFLNGLNSTLYLKHFGVKCPTWTWFINSKKEEHGIEE